MNKSKEACRIASTGWSFGPDTVEFDSGNKHFPWSCRYGTYRTFEDMLVDINLHIQQAITLQIAWFVTGLGQEIVDE